jgi:hypothetical protein
MNRIASDNPSHLCYRRGTGWFGLIGLPFLLFGLIAIPFCAFAMRAFGIWGILVGLVMGGTALRPRPLDPVLARRLSL